MKIAILDDYLDSARHCAPFDSLAPAHEVTIYTRQMAEAELVSELSSYDVLLVMRERTAFPATLIRQLPHLKLIVTTGRRNDVIDLDACREAGITVCGTDSPARGPAELSLALMMAAAKGLVAEHESMRAGGWQTALAGNVHGRTLGLLGLGRLGGMLAGYANMLGMRVIAWSTNLTAERARECNAELVDKDTVMAESDFISIHLRLSERTHHLVTARELALMKDGAWIINTSRAPIIDTAALLAELRRGRIHAALDVFDIEPPAADDELRRLPNVILSPHKGYVTTDTFQVFYQQSLDNLLAWLDGKPINVIS